MQWASYESQANSGCLNGPCYPGNEFCNKPFTDAPKFHLMDQHGCGENDPNGPVFDPVHGVVHHFYQIHLAAQPGHGPDYGHFVSKDFIHWAQMPVAIWNGLDSSVWPPKVTPYDNEAIFTGSAVVVDGAAPDGKGLGIVNMYPGLCNDKDWPACKTGTLLAQAVPANYATDPLLTNWTKPSYNPIIQNTQRDPSTPWQTPWGEWRLRTYDSMVYGTNSSQDMLAGKWYVIGKSEDFRRCECPSLYPLPPATQGTEAAYAAAQKVGNLPDTVHKTSCGGDWWQVGTYIAGRPKTLGTFTATPSWSDLFSQRKIDQGNFYASKDNEYPTLSGGKRRINWGWATVPPASTQTLPREITFHIEARALQQYPIEELTALRAPAVFNQVMPFSGSLDLGLAAGVARQSELNVSFELPMTKCTFGAMVGSLSCVIEYTPAAATVPVACGNVRDTLTLLPSEKNVELRIFSDWTFIEAYFQQGRVSMTKAADMSETTALMLTSTTTIHADASAFPIKSIWVDPAAVLSAPRIYH
eukprot:CAMPEP_0119304042 /NCGR_PEP_ID=MMETSP1333-20130426/5366_1 /TAXON_ID=418940 /ORGANISM="Scyphosphaera apsteinii, Strain RCC1455" /LENGTH=526 /DNA_ID=CAMNT_0007306853 /DNA_START=97 /DNA_END=1677 /DNA_ORIENTATION=+